MNRYTNQQETSIVEVYIFNPQLSRTNRALIADALHPNTHSIASWAATFGQLEALDNTNPKASRFVVSQTLAAVAATLSPIHFS